MNKKKKRRRSKRQLDQVEPTVKQRFLAWWGARRPAAVFIFTFFVIMGGFYAIYTNPSFKANIFPTIIAWNAKAGSFLLNIFGFGTEAMGENIRNADFSVAIKRGCDGLEPIALLLAVMAAFPVSWRKKLIGLGLGAISLLLLNVIRVATLFVAGLHSYELFDTMHVLVWQFLFIIITLIICAIWVNWATKISIQHDPT